MAGEVHRIKPDSSKEPPYSDVARMPESPGNRLLTWLIPGSLATALVLSVGSACGVLGGSDAPGGWRPGLPLPPKEADPNPSTTPSSPSPPAQTPVRPLTYNGVLAANPGMLTVATNDDSRGWNQATLGYVKSIDQIDVVAWCRDADGKLPPRKVHATAFTSRDKDKSVATNDPEGRGWPGEFKPFSPPPESIAAFDRMLVAEARDPGTKQSVYSAEEHRLAGEGIGQAECQTVGMNLSSVVSVEHETLVSERVLTTMAAEKNAEVASENNSRNLKLVLIIGGILAVIALARNAKVGNKGGSRSGGVLATTARGVAWTGKKVGQGLRATPGATKSAVTRGQQIGVEVARKEPIYIDATPEEVTKKRQGPQLIDVIRDDGTHIQVPERPTHGEFSPPNSN